MSGKHDKKLDDEQSAKLLLTGPIVIRGLGRSVKDALLPGRPSRHRAFVAGAADGDESQTVQPTPVQKMLSDGPTVSEDGPTSELAAAPSTQDVAADGAALPSDPEVAQTEEVDGPREDRMDERREGDGSPEDAETSHPADESESVDAPTPPDQVEPAGDADSSVDGVLSTAESVDEVEAAPSDEVPEAADGPASEPSVEAGPVVDFGSAADVSDEGTAEALEPVEPQTESEAVEAGPTAEEGEPDAVSDETSVDADALAHDSESNAGVAEPDPSQSFESEDLVDAAEPDHERLERSDSSPEDPADDPGRAAVTNAADVRPAAGDAAPGERGEAAESEDGPAAFAPELPKPEPEDEGVDGSATREALLEHDTADAAPLDQIDDFETAVFEGGGEDGFVVDPVSENEDRSADDSADESSATEVALDEVRPPEPLDETEDVAADAELDAAAAEAEPVPEEQFGTASAAESDASASERSSGDEHESTDGDGEHQPEPAIPLEDVTEVDLPYDAVSLIEPEPEPEPHSVAVSDFEAQPAQLETESVVEPQNEAVSAADSEPETEPESEHESDSEAQPAELGSTHSIDGEETVSGPAGGDLVDDFFVDDELEAHVPESLPSPAEDEDEDEDEETSTDDGLPRARGTADAHAPIDADAAAGEQDGVAEPQLQPETDAVLAEFLGARGWTTAEELYSRPIDLPTEQDLASMEQSTTSDIDEPVEVSAASAIGPDATPDEAEPHGSAAEPEPEPTHAESEMTPERAEPTDAPELISEPEPEPEQGDPVGESSPRQEFEPEPEPDPVDEMGSAPELESSAESDEPDLVDEPESAPESKPDSEATTEPDPEPDSESSPVSEPATEPAVAAALAAPAAVAAPARPAPRPERSSRPPRRARPVRERFGREAIGIAVLVVLALVCGGLITAVVLKTQKDAAVAAQEAANYTPPPLATPTPAATGPVVAVIGDGTTSAAASGVTTANKWSALLGTALDGTVTTDASSGMGYAAKGGSGETFAQAAAKVPTNADVVIFFGGAADSDIAALSLAKATTDAFSAAKTQAPDAKIIVVGPAIAGGASDADLTAIRNNLRVSAGIAKATWVDPIDKNWLSASKQAATSPSALTAADEKTLASKMEAAVKKAVG